MNIISNERLQARSAGEIIPSFVLMRRFIGGGGEPPSLGYYTRRYTFRPIKGEALTVYPHEIEEVD